MSLHRRIEFEWDEDKRLRNIDKHGIDFYRAELVFDGRPVVTNQSTYELEVRFVSIAVVDGRCIAVIWTKREAAIRLISARRARDAEERAYRSLYG